MCAKHFTYDVRELIALVKEEPCIWNRKSELYKDREERRAGWEKIFRKLEPNYDNMDIEQQRTVETAITTKWTNLRDTFVRYVKAANDGKPRRKYLYHEALSFLLTLFPEVDTSLLISSMDTSDTHTYDTSYEQDSEEIEIYTTHTNEIDLAGNSNDSEDYKPVLKKNRKKHNIIVKSETPIKEDPFGSCQETEVVEVSGSDARIMNEDEAFFASLLPTVVRYSEDERLEFRIKVLAAMKEIRNKNRIEFSE